MELNLIAKDVKSGVLPRHEIVRFVLWMITKNLGRISFAILIGAALYFWLR